MERVLKTNLHRAGKQAGWERVPKNQQNIWQRVAANTKGILTPANVISVLGAALVGVGLWHIYTDNLAWGFVYVAVGRLADILDGAIAQATGTKSSLGEAVDAGLDKIIVIAALAVFFVTGTVPLLAAILIGARNIVNMTIGLLAKAHKKTLHPTRAGKFAAMLEWSAILLFIMAAILDAQASVDASLVTTICAYVILGMTLLLGGVAIKQYTTAASKPDKL